MGRRRTKLNLSPRQQAQALHRIRVTKDEREWERLRFALQAAQGRHTLEELAEILRRSRSTLQNWLLKFEAGGLAGLLGRDTPPGMASPIGAPRIQNQLKAGLQSGRWRSASDIAQWLEKAHHIRRSRKSIYYWITLHRQNTSA